MLFSVITVTLAETAEKSLRSMRCAAPREQTKKIERSNHRMTHYAAGFIGSYIVDSLICVHSGHPLWIYRIWKRYYSKLREEYHIFTFDGFDEAQSQRVHSVVNYLKLLY